MGAGGAVLESFSKSGGVASEEPLASAVGLGILLRGGNAVDAAVAVSFALSVVAPHLGGVGGDFFSLVMTPGGRVYFFNGSGQAPARLTPELLEGLGYREAPSRGPLAPTVPGMVGGLYLMWRRLGSLEWRDLVEPAIRLAGEGFPVPPSLAAAIGEHKELLGIDPGSRATYLEGLEARPGGPARLPGLARLLEGVAEDPWFLYRGEPAERIEEYLSERGGVLASSDMRAYEPVESEPLSLDYRGWRLWEMPPNSQGATSLHILAILERVGAPIPRRPLERVPLLVAASLPAYRFRDREIGDPRYMRVKPWELVSDSLLDRLAGEAPGQPPPCKNRSQAGGGDTTFYIVVDADGMVVAGIQSLFYHFGSGVTEPTYQLTLNGRVNGFTLERGLPNTLAPGKRPLHTLSALVAESPEGEVAVMGSSGGHFRPQQHALLATSIIDHGMSPGEAVAAERVLWKPYTCELVADEGIEEVPGMPPGYRVTHGRTGVAAAALRVAGGYWILATDPRGDGYPYIAPS
ncbi:MAG: gamma-glutamyltransferase family protein [Desulfurococcales archaeon]|nr:gamma-glutamyltransferase family protein [Desulfurococcales archaeon]